jgi:hypothetical protein
MHLRGPRLGRPRMGGRCSSSPSGWGGLSRVPIGTWTACSSVWDCGTVEQSMEGACDASTPAGALECKVRTPGMATPSNNLPPLICVLHGAHVPLVDRVCSASTFRTSVHGHSGPPQTPFDKLAAIFANSVGRSSNSLARRDDATPRTLPEAPR